MPRVKIIIIIKASPITTGNVHKAKAALLVSRCQLTRAANTSKGPGNLTVIEANTNRLR